MQLGVSPGTESCICDPPAPAPPPPLAPPCRWTSSARASAAGCQWTVGAQAATTTSRQSRADRCSRRFPRRRQRTQQRPPCKRWIVTGTGVLPVRAAGTGCPGRARQRRGGQESCLRRAQLPAWHLPQARAWVSTQVLAAA